MYQNTHTYSQPGFRANAAGWHVAVIPIAAALALAGCGKQQAQPRMGGMPPVPVSVAVAAQESVPVQIRVVGTVEPSITVQVKSQVAGELMSVHFTEGSDVRKDDLLFEIDARPYRQALAQAEAAVAKDHALLAQSQANLGRDQAQAKSAEADAYRYEQLAKENVASAMQATQQRAAADAAHESVRADQAAIDSARASLASDQSAVARAKLDLSYCQIRSPIDGRTGNVLVHAGNLVKVNDVPLVVVNRIAPIFVSFGVPEEHLAAIRRRAREGLEVEASSDDEPGKISRGRLKVVDNAVDTNTGTIKLKAVFDNAAHLLWPGQFVNVVLTLDTQSNATVVPSEAVQDGQRGQFVFVVKADQTVESRPVTVTRTIGRKAVIAKGVVPGETVVTDGQLRLFPGATIHPVPAGKVDNLAL
ncbi:MAG TPA: efflux RND transporter periplasmic adaptor subunit [Bryobacteraceae bacterium]|nr:efflux RND transporter periplasmic adaptor subunit [Bryobacteraceae bacterium]